MPLPLIWVAAAAAGSYFAGKKADDISSKASAKASSATYELNSAKERLEHHVNNFNDEIQNIHNKYADEYAKALDRSNSILTYYDQDIPSLRMLNPPSGFSSIMLIKSAKNIATIHNPEAIDYRGKKLVAQNHLKSAHLAKSGTVDPVLAFTLGGFASISEAYTLVTKAESYKADVDKYICEIDKTIDSIDQSKEQIDNNVVKIEKSLKFFNKYISDAESLPQSSYNRLSDDEKKILGYLFHIQTTMNDAADTLCITNY